MYVTSSRPCSLLINATARYALRELVEVHLSLDPSRLLSAQTAKPSCTQSRRIRMHMLRESSVASNLRGTPLF